MSKSKKKINTHWNRFCSWMRHSAFRELKTVSRPFFYALAASAFFFLGYSHFSLQKKVYDQRLELEHMKIHSRLDFMVSQADHEIAQADHKKHEEEILMLTTEIIGLKGEIAGLKVELGVLKHKPSVDGYRSEPTFAATSGGSEGLSCDIGLPPGTLGS